MKKNSLVIVLVIIIILLAGYIFYTKNNSKVIYDLPAPDISDVQNIPNTPTNNNVVNNTTNNTQANNSDCMPTTAPWIKVLSPNGGETYTAGQKVEVKWNNCNIPDKTNVSIFIDGFESMNSPYRWSALVSTGSFLWTVPDMSATNLSSFKLGFNAGGALATSGTFMITSPLSAKEQSCINSGGKVSTGSVCSSNGDFSQTCMPASCALSYSHQAKICNCGVGKCFNGIMCVDFPVR